MERIIRAIQTCVTQTAYNFESKRREPFLHPCNIRFITTIWSDRGVIAKNSAKYWRWWNGWITRWLCVRYFHVRITITWNGFTPLTLERRCDATAREESGLLLMNNLRRYGQTVSLIKQERREPKRPDCRRRRQERKQAWRGAAQKLAKNNCDLRCSAERRRRRPKPYTDTFVTYSWTSPLYFRSPIVCKVEWTEEVMRSGSR